MAEEQKKAAVTPKELDEKLKAIGVTPSSTKPQKSIGGVSRVVNEQKLNY